MSLKSAEAARQRAYEAQFKDGYVAALRMLSKSPELALQRAAETATFNAPFYLAYRSAVECHRRGAP